MLNKLKEILETKTGMEVIFEDATEVPLFVDMQTANAMLLVYNHLSENSQAIFEQRLSTRESFIKTSETCWRCIK